MNEPYINISALEPLFAPHEEPNRHRVRADTEGQPARIVTGRRRTPIAIAQNLRPLLNAWRDNDYPGASDTTRELLHHWSSLGSDLCGCGNPANDAQRVGHPDNQIDRPKIDKVETAF